MDEPTTGYTLGYKKIIEVLQELVNNGNTNSYEHNLDVIKCSDWIIDLGKEGGNNGGEIIAKARQKNSKIKESYTGLYLSNI